MESETVLNRATEREHQFGDGADSHGGNGDVLGISVGARAGRLPLDRRHLVGGELVWDLRVNGRTAALRHEG